MSTPLIDFESSRVRDQRRLEAQQARKSMLEKVRAQHDAKRQQLEAAKKRGEDSWMLPAVEKTLLKQGDQQLKKKSKKEKKQKKKKKKKKSKKDSSSSSGSSSETEWVEKTAAAARPEEDASSGDSCRAASQAAQSPEVQKPSRDDWMEMPSLFGTYTRDELRQKEGGSRALAKQLEKLKAREPDKPGSHALELNPYFKDGGSGLPQCAAGAGDGRTGSSAPLVGFGASAAWLKKSLQRAKEQAAEENITLEEVAEKRWGSLDKFYELLREAEARDAAVVEARSRPMYAPRADGSAPRSSDTRDARQQENRFRNDGKDSRSRRESDARFKRRSRSPDRRARPRSASSSSSSSRSRSRSRSLSRSHRRETQKLQRRKESSSSSRSRSRSPSRGGKERRGKQSSNRRRQSSELEDDRRAFRRDAKKPSESKNRRVSRRKSSSSYTSSSSGDERMPRKRSQLSSSQVHRYGNRDDDRDQRSSARRLLKPGDSERTLVNDHDGRQERAVWENTRQLPSSAAPASGSWRKKAQQTQHASPAEAISCGDRVDKEDNMECAEGSKSPQDSKTASPVRVEPSEDKDVKVELKPKKVYTTHELNQIGAKIVKAELVGNEALATKLKKKLENARKETQEALAAGGQSGGESRGKVEEETVLLTTTDSKGFTRPITSVDSEQSSSSRRAKKPKISTVGADGGRDKYFPDDHKFSLKQMFEQEKQGGTEESDAMFVRAAARSQKASLDDDYTLDDSFVDKSAMREDRGGQDSRDRMKAIMDHQRREQALASCSYCCDSTHMKKHLIISLGSKSYLSLPSHESLVEGHCLIVPRDHLATSTLLDEDAWLEMTDYRKSLVRFFNSRDEDVVFIECCMYLRRQPHTVVHCLPMPRELGDLAPIYFKKAIQESESEWNQNVKLVDLKGRDVRRAIPRGFPYFAVDFGTSPGYAHVIEDEASFPRHFGQSVVGGMLDVETQLWRKPKQENFDQQRRKVLAFAKDYERFDPAQET